MGGNWFIVEFFLEKDVSFARTGTRNNGASDIFLGAFSFLAQFSSLISQCLMPICQSNLEIGFSHSNICGRIYSRGQQKESDDDYKHTNIKRLALLNGFDIFQTQAHWRRHFRPSREQYPDSCRFAVNHETNSRARSYPKAETPP